jgi:hypothetical protein
MLPTLTPEETLATLETGRVVTSTDPEVITARRLLAQLAALYPGYTHDRVAEIAVTAYQLLRDQSIAITILEFVQETTQAIPPPAAGPPRYEVTCGTLVASLSAQRKP